MKAILMSIRPEWVCKILNGEKTIEIRKKFPKDYVGWVYIYCTNENDLLCQIDNEWNTIRVIKGAKWESIYNGKVVARFWCDKVDKVHLRFEKYCAGELSQDGLLKYACLTEQELDNYLWSNICCGYAIHITEVKPFDEPKEINEFMKTLDNFNGLDCFRCSKRHNCSFNRNKKCEKLKLTRAPESWQYIEV